MFIQRGGFEDVCDHFQFRYLIPNMWEEIYNNPSDYRRVRIDLEIRNKDIPPYLWTSDLDVPMYVHKSVPLDDLKEFLSHYFVGLDTNHPCDCRETVVGLNLQVV
jgi:hypothetical protein